MSPELIGTLVSTLSVMLTIGGFVWRLSARLGSLDIKMQITSEQLKRVDSELQDIKHALNDAREGRQALWVEMNGLRERLARLEATS